MMIYITRSNDCRFRVLTVIDDCTRECLGLIADTSSSGLRVARELDQIIEDREKLRMLAIDRIPASPG